MTERRLPDPRCGSICRNVNGEKCIEVCAPQGEGEYFEVKPDLTLHQMPDYPNTDDLKPRLQFKIEKAYTKKIYSHLTGKE